MAYFRCGTGGGIPAQLVTDMNAVLNKKFGTSSQSYPYTEWASDVNLMGLLPEKIASGAVASFTDGADDVPVKEAVFDITAVQAGTGDPTPSNVRAISGYTGMNVSKAGKNLLSGVPENGTLLATDGTTSSSASYGTTDYILMKKGTYTASALANKTATGSSVSVRVAFYDLNQTFYNYVSRSDTRVTGETYALSFTLSEDSYIRVCIRVNGMQDPQIEVGSSFTEYVAYSAPTVIPVSWQTEAGTVYGGSLNLTTGVLTVTHTKKTVTGGSWAWYETYKQGYSNILTSTPAKIGTIPIADKCKGISVNDRASNVGNFVCLVSSGTGLGFSLPDITTEAAFNTWMSQNSIDVVYELATPVTYQLTPHQINTLLGNNNIWADTGDASATYRADISGGIREYLFKMDGTVSSFWANSWAERQRYLYNIGKWAFDQSKDIYIDVEFNGLPSSELNIVNFYVSDNRVFKVRKSGSAAQCKVQFGGGDAISWTAFDETKTLSFRLLRNYKIQIFSGDSLIASYDAPDSGSYRSIWNNTDGNIFCYGSTLAEYNIKSINMYAK